MALWQEEEGFSSFLGLVTLGWYGGKENKEARLELHYYVFVFPLKKFPDFPEKESEKKTLPNHRWNIENRENEIATAYSFVQTEMPFRTKLQHSDWGGDNLLQLCQTFVCKKRERKLFLLSCSRFVSFTAGLAFPRGKINWNA